MQRFRCFNAREPYFRALLAIALANLGWTGLDRNQQFRCIYSLEALLKSPTSRKSHATFSQTVQDANLLFTVQLLRKRRKIRICARWRLSEKAQDRIGRRPLEVHLLILVAHPWRHNRKWDDRSGNKTGSLSWTGDENEPAHSLHLSRCTERRSKISYSRRKSKNALYSQFLLFHGKNRTIS